MLSVGSILEKKVRVSDKDRVFDALYVVLIFNEEVKGSFVFVVEEGGKDVEISVPIPDPSEVGESENFVVAGTKKVLTHDSNYTIKSFSPKPETDSTPIVWMSDTITFHIPKSSYDEKKSQLTPEMKKLLSWLIPLIVCLFVGLLIAIVIIVVVHRRKSKTPANPTELEEQVQVDVEAKMEVLPDEGHTNGFLQAGGLTHSAFQSTGDDVPEGTHAVDPKPLLTETELAEVMVCSGDYPVTVARVHETLYYVLHKEQRDIRKRTIGIQIVNGLKEVVANRGWSDVLTRLSSHWVLLDTEGNVQLKLQMNASEAEQEALHTQQKNQNGEMNSASQGQQEKKSKVSMDGLRWRAPEVVDGKQVDGHKAAVFSLGLVLWEMETGEVPFGEVDAVNAQRQSGTGVGPKMSEMKNEELKSMILRCVSVDPKDRPTLTEVGDFLNSQPEDPNLASRNDMGEANS
ncbi:hypothetical protein BLNAU_4375 [Blattamonas nauphoetae]|uniref:Protein kinase domain-containing protein n=1 Tax=Blattamonas nauphoetae TaxID=2049346 RepID=A0ABQ9YAH6_9EUKA|nr:hypothetical protein BLNAU_4375 [Blattamonas nauphoetae]